MKRARVPSQGSWFGRRWRRLESRFMVHFGVIVLSLMAFVAFLVEHTMSRTMVQETRARGVAIAHSIAALVKGDLLSYDYVSLQQAAETATLEEGVLHVIILDKERVVAAYSGRPELQGRPFADSDADRPHPSFYGESVRRVEAAPASGVPEPYLDVTVPVIVAGTPVQWGTVRIGLSLAPMQATLARTRLVFFVLGLGAVCIVLVSARFLSRQITQPLAELAEATAVIATGDLDHSVDEGLVGELGDLARSFNIMTNDLRRSRDAIRYQNQHLENMVRLRTSALQEKARQLEIANKELKELDRLKSDFLSNVSHELRTPLTSIRSFTEIMRDEGQGLVEEERQEFLGIVSSQADRLTRLISDLLDLSKIEAGGFQCQMTSLAVPKAVEACLETLRSMITQRGIKLRTQIDADLPPVWADADRVNQVLTNLVENASKFTPAGGTITVTARRDTRRRVAVLDGDGVPEQFAGVETSAPPAAEYVLISVRDTGIGIAPEDQQRIFDKFAQVGNVLTDKPQGTGLGLAISGRIIVQHGGALWVESVPGVGSVFSFSLPVASAEAQATATGDLVIGNPRSDFIVDAVRRTTPGKQILIVDDEPAIVAVLTELLEPTGYRTVGCQSGSQAVARARELQPDAIILDIMMPEINGYDVLRLLKSDPSTSNIPVIVLSVLDDKQKAFELGAAEYVRKPFEKSELLENVRALA